MQKIQLENGMEYWHAKALAPVQHGFFTRKGGRSAPPIESLNCGFGADEPRETVLANRELVAEALSAPNLPQTVYQYHSADVVTLNAPIDGEAPKADAIVTNRPNLPIGILTADCAPVLLADASAGVIGAAHAGWRGAVGGVLANTLEAMRALGAKEISAVVGPCISMQNYEVGPDFIESLLAEDARFVEYISGDDKTYFNLPRFVLDRLREDGVETAEWIGECTYADPARYYSYRYAQHNRQPDYGRLISAIMIEELR